MNETQNQVPFEPSDQEPSVVQSQSNAAPQMQNEISYQSPIPEAAPAKPHPVTRAIASPLFLTIAILISASTAFGFLSALSNGSFSLDVFSVLTTIGVWIAYANAKKTPVTNAMSASGLNLLSGTTKAARIVMLVSSIILFACGGLLMIMAPIFAMNAEASKGFMDGFSSAFSVYGIPFDFNMTLPAAAWVIAFAILFILIGLLFLLVYYLFFLKTAHRFIYSVCENVKHGAPIESAQSLSTWLMVIGIISAVGAIGSILAGGTMAAALIITSVWIRKSFVE